MMRYLFLFLLIGTTVFAQDASRVEQNRLRAFAEKGDYVSLKSAAYALKGSYDPTQITESYIQAISKNRTELLA